MGVLRWIEEVLDKFIPAVSVSGQTSRRFHPDSFHALMEQLLSEEAFTLRSIVESGYVVSVPGQTMGNLSQIKSLFGDATSARYMNMKSRLRCVLLNDGSVHITSFEHLVGTQKERDAFREVLTIRLEYMQDRIETKDIEAGNTSTE